ncbi:hypothetical protein HDU99_007841 [Rhizoclosmatium hyalinum]|nr:hypothetical protein HDU99_007841 [Rhizoclosmatium hyalinum]
MDVCRSSGPSETPAETLKNIIRNQEKLAQDLKTLIPALSRPAPSKPAAPVASAASALDSLLDKAHETSELNNLKKEIDALKSKLALQDTTLVSLRANLVVIFNQLKLSAITPDETSVDDYVATIRDLMAK